MKTEYLRLVMGSPWRWYDGEGMEHAGYNSLNGAGADGWDLVGIEPFVPGWTHSQYVFKRELSPGRESAPRELDHVEMPRCAECGELIVDPVALHQDCKPFWPKGMRHMVAEFQANPAQFGPPLRAAAEATQKKEEGY
jgi:hypothetical protein